MFEIWLRTQCFKAPPKHSYDLAKAAWNEAIKQAEDAIWNASCSDCDAGSGAQSSAAEAVEKLNTP